MRISTRTRYGLRALADLARGYPDRPIPLAEVARRQRISVKYLEQVVAILKAAKLVKPIRGVNGGYVLAMPPAEISLREVFDTLEGPAVLVECVGDPGPCPLAEVCPTRETWFEMSRALFRILESTTVGDLLERSEQKRRSSVLDYVI